MSGPVALSKNSEGRSEGDKKPLSVRCDNGLEVINTLSDVKTEKTGRKKRLLWRHFFFAVLFPQH